MHNFYSNCKRWMTKSPSPYNSWPSLSISFNTKSISEKVGGGWQVVTSLKKLTQPLWRRGQYPTSKLPCKAILSLMAGAIPESSFLNDSDCLSGRPRSRSGRYQKQTLLAAAIVEASVETSWKPGWFCIFWVQYREHSMALSTSASKPASPLARHISHSLKASTWKWIFKF